jgi:N-methylhydantoinase A/oxoprolinase/acetone carboxylase beta subunit
MVPCHDLATLAPGALVVGPAAVVDTVGTTYVDAGWRALVDPAGNLLLEVH